LLPLWDPLKVEIQGYAGHVQRHCPSRSSATLQDCCGLLFWEQRCPASRPATLPVPLGLPLRKRGKRFHQWIFSHDSPSAIFSRIPLDFNPSEGIPSASIRTAIYGRARVLKGALYFTPTASWRNGMVGHSRDFCNHPSGPSTNLSALGKHVLGNQSNGQCDQSSNNDQIIQMSQDGDKIRN
jgi:hypothetical protein